ncbi:hypothetical protein [Dickeya zeae]|uniref:hypothetical protein n=1 Tax=Dickeya zeae TaxID=204042 RepID=UPI0008FBF680|nr:hypothetical protein [Dickeya zeae]
MELLETKFISCVTLLDVRLSEGEVTVLADCLNFMLNNCSDEQINQETECESKEELSWYRNSLLELLKAIENKEYLPERYKNL